ncbi:lantibiotic dehydratase [Chryseobacterium sp. G0186]|uniref:thiopeptide-type bacteriocin biosynthesis protein n=1 Tax=Chryseobacterium sp. G0186 TaxID=2487064 RepID=UPI000F4FDBA8|nr:thiopeptide-type bacteriocin biosynthesis protein [Chryseobacterium sp. G0186]AZA79217.1 lantibiotic dehydratase [Chryseobacterium sp. G0186]
MNALREFIPGSEWLYIKIYTGIKTSDIILEEAVIPLLQEFQQENLMKKWFFIRYNDPRPHLRIRFELSDSSNFNKIFALINEYLKEYVDSGEISSLLLDTYQREIERYGKETIEQAELLFWKSSSSVLYNYLHFDDEDKIIVSLFYMDTLLELLGLTVQKKLDWVKQDNLAFKYEFNADKKLNSQLDKKYRMFIPRYTEFEQSDEYRDFREDIMAEINESEKELKHIVKHYPGSAHEFFQSVFHMHINRMFVSNQRMFEMVIYDYLFRYYKSLAFKSNLKS